MIRRGCAFVLPPTLVQWVGLAGRAAGTPRHHQVSEMGICQSRKINVKPENTEGIKKCGRICENSFSNSEWWGRKEAIMGEVRSFKKMPGRGALTRLAAALGAVPGGERPC